MQYRGNYLIVVFALFVCLLFSVSCEGLFRNEQIFNNEIIDYNNHEYH